VTSPRVPLLSTDEAHAAAETVGISTAVADLNVFRAWLHQPQLAGWLHALIMGLLGKGMLDARLRELVIMRLGWATGSDYEWTQHWRIATEVLGVDADDVLAVRSWQDDPRFGPAERAILAATDDAVTTGAVGAEALAACASAISDEPAVLVEVVAVIATWQMVSTFLRSLAVPLEDGVRSWPPDGIAPEERTAR
jgi:alkylhydroperoxidase family enzyme